MFFSNKSLLPKQNLDNILQANQDYEDFEAIKMPS